MKLEDIKEPYRVIGETETPHITWKGEKACFLIRCRVCNRGLCKCMTIAKTPRRGENMIFVEPCPNCLQAAREGREPQEYEMNGEWQTRERF